MYSNMHEMVKEKYAKIKLEIDDQLDVADHILAAISERRDELKSQMENVLKCEIVMEQKEDPEGLIGIVVEPEMVTEVEAACDLEYDYPAYDFSEVCFTLGEGIVGLFDENYVAVEDNATYQCGPMFIIGMDEYGNLCTLTDENIKAAMDYLEMNTVTMPDPDDESLEYSVFRLE